MTFRPLGEALESALSDMLEKRPEAVTLPASQREGDSASGGGKAEGAHANRDRMNPALLRLAVNNRCMDRARPTRFPASARSIHLVLAVDNHAATGPSLAVHVEHNFTRGMLDPHMSGTRQP